jgi:colicin import membrane protein
MKGPSLQKSAAISASFHITILILSIVAFRHTNHIVIPSPYMVSLVSPSKSLKRTAKKPAFAPRKAPIKKVPVTKIKKPIPSKSTYAVKQLKRDLADKKRIEDRISELEAKKRVERIVKLRSIISLKDAAEEQPVEDQTAVTGPSKGTLFDSYYLMISGEIWQEWVYPDFGKKDLETVVFIRIMKDGKIVIQGIDKSSGNKIFDRSALKALAKASPVSPPPYEMELGIRFYP